MLVFDHALTGVEPDGRGRTPPESRPHAATEMNFGLREKYAEIMVFEEIIRYSPRRRALPCIAEGFSPTASAV
jgi:hypothetical protein